MRKFLSIWSRRLAPALAASLAGTMLVLAPVAADDPAHEPWDGKAFTIRPFSDARGAIDAGQLLRVSPANEGTWQSFEPELGANGWYRIESTQNKGYYLTYSAPGGGIRLAADNEVKDRMFWKFERTANGMYRIISKDDGLVLQYHADGGVSTSGGPVYGMKYEWNLTEIGGVLRHNHIYTVESVIAENTFASPVSADEYTKVVAVPGPPGTLQQWVVLYYPEVAAYQFRNVEAPSRSLSWDSNTEWNVVLASGDNTDQWWVVRQNEDGKAYDVMNLQARVDPNRYVPMFLITQPERGGDTIFVAGTTDAEVDPAFKWRINRVLTDR